MHADLLVIWIYPHTHMNKIVLLISDGPLKKLFFILAKSWWSHIGWLWETHLRLFKSHTNKSTSWLCHAIRVCTKNCTFRVKHLISQIVPNKLDKSHWSNLNGSLLKDLVYSVLIWGEKWRQATFFLVLFFGACNGSTLDDLRICQTLWKIQTCMEALRVPTILEKSFNTIGWKYLIQ